MQLVRIALGWNGRIDRMTFLCGAGALAVASLASQSLGWKVAPLSRGAQWIVWGVVALPLFWSGFVLNVKRLRDMGRSPFLAFLPTLLVAGALILAVGGTFASVRRGDEYMFFSALILGGFAVVIAALASFAMMLWLALAGTHPSASGEDLSFAAAGMSSMAGGGATPPLRAAAPAARSAPFAAPDGAASALQRALARRAAAPSASGFAPRPPRTPGGFGRR